MYSYHVLLLPVAVVALVTGHVLLVRKHGVVPPFPLAQAGTAEPRRAGADAGRLARDPGRADGGVDVSRESRRRTTRSRAWHGRYRHYDIVKEFCIALGVVLAISVVLTILFSSPDEKPTTIPVVVADRPGRLRHHRDHRARRLERVRQLRSPVQQRERQRPARVVPPSSALAWRQPSGQHRPGLRARAAAVRSLTARCSRTRSRTYQNASASQQTTWTSAYEKALGKAQRHLQRRDHRGARQLRPAVDHDALAA